jgi:drug/metabolite transporter (DMT)-like permease
MAGAALFLGEEIVLAQVVGAVVVLGALGVLVWRRQPEEPELPLEVAEQPL